MRTVLLIDDASLMRKLIQVHLTADCTVIGEAENGRIGVEKYKELKPDIVFLDNMMEDMGGLDALKEIIQYDANAKVIVVSSVIEQITEEAISLGAKAVLNKPPSHEDVVAALGKL